MTELYDEQTGAVIGHALEAEDGNVVAVDLAGNVVAAATPAGEVLDATGYELDQSEYVTHDELRQYQEYLQQQQAQAPTYYVDTDPGPDPAAVEAMLDENLQRVERDYGRKLTNAEADRLYREVNSQIEAGQQPNWDAAGFEAGIKHADAMNHEDRAEYMTARLRDQEPAREARETYDLDNTESRQAYVRDRLDGLIEGEAA